MSTLGDRDAGTDAETARRAGWGSVAGDARDSTAPTAQGNAMDSLTVARSLRGSIGMLAMAWLINDRTTERAVELGLDAEGRGGYAVGRLGVLGHCPVDAVVSAAYFWEPRLMRQMGTAGRAAATPAEGAAICSDFPRVDRMAVYHYNPAAEPAGAKLEARGALPKSWPAFQELAEGPL